MKRVDVKADKSVTMSVDADLLSNGENFALINKDLTVEVHLNFEGGSVESTTELLRKYADTLDEQLAIYMKGRD